MKALLKRGLDCLGVRETLWDSWLYRTLWRDAASREHDAKVADFYRGLAQENKLIGALWFDIGANAGGKAAVFLKLCGKLVAVEPDPNNFGILSRRLRFRPKATLVKAAVGARSGVLTLHCAGAYSTVSKKEANLLRGKDGFMGGGLAENALAVDVPVITLDELIRQYGGPAFVKIDVEGFEAEVFEGLSHSIRMICFEANLPAFEDETVRCISKYSSLCEAEFNFTTEEPPVQFARDEWLSPSRMIECVKSRKLSYAEIYGRAVGQYS
jgi:FkbM family methyltransferase